MAQWKRGAEEEDTASSYRRGVRLSPLLSPIGRWMKYWAAEVPEVSAENTCCPRQRRVFKRPGRVRPGELRRMHGEGEIGGGEEEADRQEGEASSEKIVASE